METGTVSFTIWLTRELVASRDAVLTLYETIDRVRYSEAPALRAQYMMKVGCYEQKVLEAELDTALLGRRKELIQAALNRREAIDPAAIGAALASEREAMLRESEQKDLTLSSLPTLTSEEQQELQRIYSRIIREFHPALTSDLTPTQHQLYDRACDAYRRQNLEELRLVYDMLFHRESELPAPQEDIAPAQPDSFDMAKFERAVLTDYTLAAQLYPFFEPTPAEQQLLEDSKRCAALSETLSAQLTQLRTGFPFSAKKTLEDPQLLSDYLNELTYRLRAAGKRKESLSREIDAMMEGTPNGR